MEQFVMELYILECILRSSSKKCRDGAWAALDRLSLEESYIGSFGEKGRVRGQVNQSSSSEDSLVSVKQSARRREYIKELNDDDGLEFFIGNLKHEKP